MRFATALRNFLKLRETEVPPAREPASSWQYWIGAAEASTASGDLAEAIRSYARVIDLKPDHVAARYKQGNLQLAIGEIEAALSSYDQVIALDENHAYAFCNRGVALERLGRLEEANASYTRAIKIKPDDAFAHYNRATVQQALGRPEQALHDYDRAIEIKPDYTDALLNRGTLLEAIGRPERALASYEKAIEVNPADAGAHAKRGIVLTELRRWESALGAFDHSLSLTPELHEARCHRGRVYALLGRNAEAIADFDAAIALRPDDGYAYYRRADLLNQQQQFSAAIADYDRAIALNPGFPVLRGMRRFAQMKICDWGDLDADVAQFTTGLENGVCVSPPLPILALLGPANLHLQAARAWTVGQCPTNDALGPIPPGIQGSKIRVGYFSADFREHAVAQVMAAVFEAHDRSKFEMTAFAFLPRTQDAMRKRLEAAFDRFIDVGERSDLEIASLARQLQIDIAVDLGGHTAHSRPRIFALRAAPIQINYLGYPGSMGADYMDYLIADRVVIPSKHQSDYSEKILYLPHSFFPGDPTRAVSDALITRRELGLPASGFVFCCFNNNFKITPTVFEIWLRILSKVESSVLWLSRNNQDAQANLRQAALRRGIDPERLIFAERLASQDRHLARYRCADLFLDTLPYNAHATALDALSAGLPVLTCAGEGFAGRVAASMLRAVGLPELVTETLPAYENLAVCLAEDPARLTRLRNLLLDRRATAPLFDVRGYTRRLEAGYVVAHDRVQRHLAPDHIDLCSGEVAP
jgi:predicted O-linked N-acetylglucosamine transferase (SPINDLY family)